MSTVLFALVFTVWLIINSMSGVAGLVGVRRAVVWLEEVSERL